MSQQRQMSIAGGGSYSAFVSTLLAFLKQTPSDVRYDMHAMHFSMNHAPANGLWLEFGVFKGHTLRMMAQHNPRHTVYGFDSFRGLPERWRSVPYDHRLEKYVSPGAFSMSGVPPKRIPNIEYRTGWFNETLPRFLDEQKDMISFLHIDSDLYSSAAYVLTKCRPRIQNGTVLVFDELVNYPEFKEGELFALYQMLSDQTVRLKLLGHSLSKVHTHPKKDYWPQAVAFQILM